MSETFYKDMICDVWERRLKLYCNLECSFEQYSIEIVLMCFDYKHKFLSYDAIAHITQYIAWI
jgi:hypothetical protein